MGRRIERCMGQVTLDRSNASILIRGEAGLRCVSVQFLRFFTIHTPSLLLSVVRAAFLHNFEFCKSHCV